MTCGFRDTADQRRSMTFFYARSGSFGSGSRSRCFPTPGSRDPIIRMFGLPFGPTLSNPAPRLAPRPTAYPGKANRRITDLLRPDGTYSLVAGEHHHRSTRKVVSAPQGSAMSSIDR